jgi:hypothetical protein
MDVVLAASSDGICHVTGLRDWRVKFELLADEDIGDICSVTVTSKHCIQRWKGSKSSRMRKSRAESEVPKVKTLFCHPVLRLQFREDGRNFKEDILTAWYQRVLRDVSAPECHLHELGRGNGRVRLGGDSVVEERKKERVIGLHFTSSCRRSKFPGVGSVVV